MVAEIEKPLDEDQLHLFNQIMKGVPGEAPPTLFPSLKKILVRRASVKGSPLCAQKLEFFIGTDTSDYAIGMALLENTPIEGLCEAFRAFAEYLEKEYKDGKDPGKDDDEETRTGNESERQGDEDPDKEETLDPVPGVLPEHPKDEGGDIQR